MEFLDLESIDISKFIQTEFAGDPNEYPKQNHLSDSWQIMNDGDEK